MALTSNCVVGGASILLLLGQLYDSQVLCVGREVWHQRSSQQNGPQGHGTGEQETQGQGKEGEEWRSQGENKA